MSRPATHLDFRALLQNVLAQCESRPESDQTPRGTHLHPRDPAVDFARLDKLIAGFAGIYQPRRGAVGSFKTIGRAKLDATATIHTTDRPWEFQGWLPFASKRVVQLAGAFAELDLEVLSGEIHVSLLAEDGKKLVGDRYLATAGSHQIQLPIATNEVKGIVFSTGRAEGVTGAFKLHRIEIKELAWESPPATAWREAVTASASAAPTEKNQWSELEITAAMAIYRLMARGESHQSRMLLHASSAGEGTAPDWFPSRLAEQLEDFLGYAAGIEAKENSGEIAGASHQPVDRAGWRETLALREVFDGMSICPLHHEILELAWFLDLQATVQHWSLRLEWKRSALASTPVQRGVLRQLFEVICNRLGRDSQGLKVQIETDANGTRLRVSSDLRNGDLQYRDFSADVATLQRGLNNGLTELPHLVHNLGRENELEISWPDALDPFDGEGLLWECSPADSREVLHESETGGRTLFSAGLCYKTSPPNRTKANTLDQEAALIQGLCGLEFLPRIGAAKADASGSAMSYAFEMGQTVAEWNSTRPTEISIIRVIQNISDAVFRLNQRGIQHRDLRAENIFVRSDLSIRLIDFDQARPSSTADDFGNEWDEDRACAGFGGLIRQLGWEPIFLRSAGALAFAWEAGRQSAANSPGKHACYYRWQWGPLALTGERPWIERWQLLQQVFTGRSGSFLEFGCNLGLLSTYAAQLGWQSHGIDHDEVAVTAAETIAATLGAEATFRTADITKPEAFEDLAETYDMVSALSVVHWLSDPGPIEAFLRRQPRLLFEGHRSFADERDYLHSLDFPVVELLGYSERLRPVLIASQ